MKNLRPDIYKKNVFSIDYNSLKKKGIKVLLFDFDNTIIVKGKYSVDDKMIKLFKSLKKDFIVYILTNSIHIRKINMISKQLDTSYIKGARKPFKAGFKKLEKKLNKVKSNQIAMIGDQLMTDVLGGKKMGYLTILIDPINNDELLFTKINRLIEKREFKKNNIKRGEYYG